MYLDCADSQSLLRAIEKKWQEWDRAQRTGCAGADEYFATVLNHHGFITDHGHGLEMLEHCRHNRPPIVDVLSELEQRVTAGGYTGGALSVADFTAAGRPTYIFYDSARFAAFGKVKSSYYALMAAGLPGKTRR